MPNHCSNRLIVTGPADQLREFGIHAMSNEKPKDENGKEGKRNPLDLDSFLPMPKELEGGQSPFRGTPEESERLKKLYGHDNWYDWKCANQGTKWGCYDVKVTAPKGKSKVIYRFQTAWSPFAPKVLEEMSRTFPELKFRYEFAECGSAFYGYFEAEKGALTDAEDFKVEEANCVPVDENGKKVPRDSEDIYTYTYVGIPKEYVELLETSG